MSILEEGVKRLRHPVLGAIGLEFSSFAVDGRSDLGMIVYNPVDSAVAEVIRARIMSRWSLSSLPDPKGDGRMLRKRKRPTVSKALLQAKAYKPRAWVFSLTK